MLHTYMQIRTMIILTFATVIVSMNYTKIGSYVAFCISWYDGSSFEEFTTTSIAYGQWYLFSSKET